MIKAETQQKQLVEIDPKDTIQRMSACGLLIKDKAVYLIKTHSDNWEVPGGGCEDGESLTQALRRELKEEISVDATIGRLVHMRESFYHSPSGKTYHSLQFFFLVTTTDTPTAAAEAREAAFVPIKTLTEDNTNKSAYIAIKNMVENDLSYTLWNNE